MKPVVQLDRTGCGLASVAALAGVSYKASKRAARRLGIFATDCRLWSGTDYIRRLLKPYRVHAYPEEIPFVSWSTLPDLALLAIKWHRDKGRVCWHWVVFVREPDRTYVLDSQKSLKRHMRTDFHRMKPKWFIPVRRKASRV